MHGSGLIPMCRHDHLVHRWVAVLLLVLPLGGAPHSAAQSNVTAGERADRVVVVKSTHKLMLLSHGRVLKTYTVSLGRGDGRAKSKAGDRETPEGEYVIDAKNPHSRFHRALHISYPNAKDRERARKLGVSPGGDVEIHGIEEKWAWVGSLHRAMDWTAGCIAVTNPEIEEIYRLVPVGTPVEIRAKDNSAADK
jgi:murein L,D-transpeptidase YafK